ncbi:hypothetical protein EAF04_001049 [Stromatinia cepivora]|nr:hypothetical protein EAF04_001049 [Stromatinia cepivora]
MNTVNAQRTTATPPSITSATNLISSTSTTEITSSSVPATTSVIQFASSSLPKLSSNTTPESPSLNVAIGAGIGVGIAIVFLIAACVPIYKLYKRRQQAAQGQNQYNHQEPAHPYATQYPLYYQQFQEMQLASNFHQEVDGSNRKSMDRRTAVFEMSDKRQTDSWVKEMMQANQEELWMESPIR